ncbi:tRNA nucleotidyltransferase [Pseudoalteromonas luteoviolacea B = ATCC 29581]|nr:tRNA nucleotidyltransferase [Pseudoalteromonas luteoviolacea B = ATCC 29581]
MQIYLVGGAVRDELLGREIKERDYVVVGSTPQEMIEQGFTQVGKDFPVFLHPKTKEEYALARTERKNGQGYTGFLCDFTPSITLEEDLLRRDLTINAIAKNAHGELIDPFHGQHDLTARIIRHVSMAFIEDPLRVLRVARFAARYRGYGFTIAPETLSLILNMVERGELNSLTPERVWMECEKSIIDGEFATFLNYLSQFNALPVLDPNLAKSWSERRFQSLMRACHYAKEHSFAMEVHLAQLAESLDIDVIESLCIHLKLSNQCVLSLKLYHALPDNLYSPEAVSNYFNQFDFYRRPERFDLFSAILETKLQNTDSLVKLKLAFFDALSVSAKAFIEGGLKGAEIKQAIALEREKRLANALR